jgi:hypothetical protein
MSYKTHVNGGRESSGGIVLMKRSNERQRAEGDRGGKAAGQADTSTVELRTGHYTGRVGKLWLSGVRRETQASQR